MATENVLFLHCSQDVFERHRHTLSREISLLFFKFILIISTFWTFKLNNLKMKFQFWIKLFSHVCIMCVIASVRISHWSGIKQIGEAANILFFFLSFFKKKKNYFNLRLSANMLPRSTCVYARPSIHYLYFVTSVKFTFVHLGLISSVA